MLKFTHVLTIFYFLLPQIVLCQVVQFKIADKTSGQPIVNVHIEHRGKHAISNRNGLVLMKIMDKQKVHVSHISYRDTSFLLAPPFPNHIILELESQINTLPEVRVDTKPIRIFAPAKTHVFDFEFWNDSLLVMTYEREKLFRKGNEQCKSMYIGCKLLLISPIGSIIDSLPLPDLIHGFYKDPLGQVFILGVNKIALIDFKLGRLLLSELDPEEFDVYIKPLCGASATHYFFSDYEWDYPEFNYFALSKNSDKKNLVRTIRDDFTMELFRAEYKYLSNHDKLKAIRLEYKTGIDKEIFGAYMSGFPNHLYYQKLYAPLFNFGDSVFIFDQHSSQIFLHTASGANLDSIEIQYLQNHTLKFKDEIINDSKTRAFYGVFEKSGIKALRKIDPFSGESHEVINLYYSYPEKIKVLNDKVFYIYRKTGGSNTKHLFVEQI
ncbi:hypothetical protein G3O08_19230 [Cryomorpha ignava]|uniref:Carboxypeptidase-like regulatory domain-containing protein n=1 Tax=Cryomorpha ignava TaxID=101383 RepID=A0A7K3WVF0_9FLAO|nr:hypothetical protein [Cryomorpha ignava]NEN25630.1 hypothetical protein [Cryomorpha ignava]